MIVRIPVRTVSKLWGVERWFVNEVEYCLKELELRPGYMCSLHYHRVKKETFIVAVGSCILEHNAFGDRFERKLGVGDSVTILPGVPHRFWTHNSQGCLIREVSTHHDDNDVVRLEDSRRL